MALEDYLLSIREHWANEMLQFVNYQNKNHLIKFESLGRSKVITECRVEALIR